MSIATLLGTLALLCTAVPSASAQTRTPMRLDIDGATGAPDADTTARFRFDIPAQPLRDALATFGRQTGLRVELQGIESTFQSRAVSGTLTAQQALRILLEGSGYWAWFKRSQVVVVSATPPRSVVSRDSATHTLDPVLVSARAVRRAGYTAERTSFATKTDTPLRDVPQAVTVLGRDLIADQAMQNMADAVRYIPGITMGQGEGHRDAPTIRGNSSTADFFVNGVRDDAQYLRDLYNVERIEALKGPNALVFGRGGGGGVINRVTKAARWMPTRAATFEGGSFDHKRATVDVGDGLGHALAARLNALLERSSNFRDATEIERQGISPATTLLAGASVVSAGYEYFEDRRTVDRGIPSFDGRPSDADITTFFGDPDESYSRADVHAGHVTVEHDFDGKLMLRNRAHFVAYDKFYQNVFPGAVDATGAQVSLSAYNSATDRRNLFNQTDLTFSLGMGSVRQTMLVGVELGRQRTDNFRNTGFFDDQTTSVSVPFDDPTNTHPIVFRQSASDADNHVASDIVSLYAQDQIAVGSHWLAIVGVRYDRFDLAFHDNRSDASLSRIDDMLSPRVGVVYKPVEPVSFYGSYGVSHLPSSGDQFSSLNATTRALEPERFVNRELGAKWEPRPDLAVNAAVYRLDRSNTTAPDPADPSRVVQTGRQRTTGVEAGVTGNLTSRWQLAGGYAWQHARIVSRTTAAAEGATVPLVPRHTLSFWNRYQVSDRFGAGLGVVHASDMYAAIDNSVTLPSFTRLDAAFFATLGPNLRAQLNVENLFDTRYYATSHGNNNIMPGAPRTVRVSLTASR